MLLYCLIFLFVFFGILIIFFIVHNYNRSSNNNKQQNVNDSVEKSLTNTGFNITKVFYLNDNFTYNSSNDRKKYIAVDNKGKKVAFVDYKSGDLNIVNFSEILNYEIYENGSSVTSGAGFGGCFGGVFGTETNSMCRELKLIIRLKSLDKSQVVYDIISNTPLNVGLNKSTKIYKQCIESLQEVVSFLEVVKEDNSKKNHA